MDEKKSTPTNVNKNIGYFSEYVIDVLDLDDERRYLVGNGAVSIRGLRRVNHQDDRRATENAANRDERDNEDDG